MFVAVTTCLLQWRCRPKSLPCSSLSPSPFSSCRSVLEGQSSLHAKEMADLLQQLERWQQRCDALVQKYGKVDMEEYNRVLAEHSAVEARLAEAQREVEVRQKGGLLHWRGHGSCLSEGHGYMTCRSGIQGCC